MGPKGQRCRRPGTPPSRLELRYRLHVPGSFPEGQLPKALPQTLQRDPGPHMPGILCILPTTALLILPWFLVWTLITALTEAGPGVC